MTSFGSKRKHIGYISKGTIDGDIYLEKFLKKRLLPFILKHNKVDQVLFWPDIAGAHYAKQVV